MRPIDAILRTFRIYQPGDCADYTVCVRCDDEHPLLMLDNGVGDCTRCGARIQFRPNVPAAVPKVCVECAIALIAEDRAKQHDHPVG